jgi:hypothetical protein
VVAEPRSPATVRVSVVGGETFGRVRSWLSKQGRPEVPFTAEVPNQFWE